MEEYLQDSKIDMETMLMLEMITLDHTIASPFKSFVNMEYSLVTGYQHGEDLDSGGGVVDVRFIGEVETS